MSYFPCNICGQYKGMIGMVWHPCACPIQNQNKLSAPLPSSEGTVKSAITLRQCVVCNRAHDPADNCEDVRLPDLDAKKLGLITEESVYCGDCEEIRPVHYDYMKCAVKTTGNDHDATDILCDNYHIIATLHHPSPLAKFLGIVPSVPLKSETVPKFSNGPNYLCRCGSRTFTHLCELEAVKVPVNSES